VTPFSGILPAPCTREAVDHYVRHEWALHLQDVMLRRSGWHYYERESTARLEQVAAWMADAGGWSDATRAAEIAACRAGESFVRDPASPPPGSLPKVMSLNK
jgi:glycerol-3-phosphate dehydrogenase